jgi:mycofactocin precursor
VQVAVEQKESPVSEQNSAVIDPAITASDDAEPSPEVTLQDVLVEEVSIDGMCGVY